MSRRFTYDYYEVCVPGDCFDTVEELGQQAIREAEGKTRIYAMPATWTATKLAGEPGDWSVKFRVTRKRQKGAKLP